MRYAQGAQEKQHSGGSNILKGLSLADGSSVEFVSSSARALLPNPATPVSSCITFIATPSLCRLGVESFSGAEERPLAYLGLLTSALGWPNHLSTYSLGPTPCDLDSLVSDGNNNGLMLIGTHKGVKREEDGKS